MKLGGSQSTKETMPDLLTTQKLARLEIIQAYQDTKTPHTFQIKLRETCKKLYDTLSQESEKKDREKIKEEMKEFLTSIAKDLKQEESFNKSEFLTVIDKASQEFMSGYFPPNVGEYDDELQSIGSDSEDEETQLYPELGESFVLTRGIGYKTSNFDQFTRTSHRSYSEGSQKPNYSVAAVNLAIAQYNENNTEKVNLQDYFSGKYDSNKLFIKYVEMASNKIANDFSFLRNPDYIMPVVIKEKKKQIEPIYLLQDIYTNDMALFKALIDKDKRQKFRENFKNHGHPLGPKIDDYERCVMAGTNPQALMALIELLDGNDLNGEPVASKDPRFAHLIDYKDNPFTSTGFAIKAAFDYSMENKTYNVYHLQELFPNYNKQLIPQHPFMGKFYGYVMPKDEYEKFVSQSAMDVVAENNKENLLIHDEIIDEAEMTFIGGCLLSVAPKQKVPSYPDLRQEWGDLSSHQKRAMSERYGLDGSTYTQLRENLAKMINEGRDPPVLKKVFIEKFVQVLNTQNIPKPNSLTSKTTTQWTENDVLEYIKKEPLGLKHLNKILTPNNKETTECIELFNRYVASKKEFHGLFKNIYPYMLDQFEREIIDYALNKGYKILNLSVDGQTYQLRQMSKLISEIDQISSPITQIKKNQGPQLTSVNSPPMESRKTGVLHAFVKSKDVESTVHLPVDLKQSTPTILTQQVQQGSSVPDLGSGTDKEKQKIDHKM